MLPNVVNAHSRLSVRLGPGSPSVSRAVTDDRAAVCAGAGVACHIRTASGHIGSASMQLGNEPSRGASERIPWRPAGPIVLALVVAVCIFWE